MQWSFLRQIIGIGLCFLLIPKIEAQTPVVVIDSLILIGNKKTNPKLILGELPFALKDTVTLPLLLPKIHLAEQQLRNTGLFRTVKIKVINWAKEKVHLKIELKENWYFYPIPQFELADRNFNVWWVQQKRKLNRTNIGLWSIWRNPTGYNDRIKIITQIGYTRKFELSYQLPPMVRFRKWGTFFNALYSDNKESPLTTYKNKLTFFRVLDTQQRQLKRLRLDAALKYRRTIYETHRLELSHKAIYITDTLRALNPSFLNNKTSQRSLRLGYTYALNHKDIMHYPLNGWELNFELFKKGLGLWNEINTLQSTLSFGWYKKIAPNWSLLFQGKGRLLFFNGKLPYYNNKALGYFQDYIRGYQYYVIDGQHYATAKADLNYKFFDKTISFLSKRMKIPLKLHTRLHSDWGYVSDQVYAQNNPLPNQILWSVGLGIDIALGYYNAIIQVEFNTNKFGDNDIYVHYLFNF